MLKDCVLVDGLIFGNKGIEEEFYNKYSNIIRNTITTKYGNIEYIEDDVSDVMYKILTNIDKYDYKKSNLSTWVIAITKNHMIDKWRKSTTKPNDLEFIDDTNSECFNYITSNSSDYETTDILKHLSNQISVSDYNLLTMKYLWGYNYKEIADEVGETSNTVCNRVNYIRTKLKNMELELFYEN